MREAQAELALVRQAYHETELELGDAKAELRDAEKIIEQLRADNGELLRQLAGNKVVKLEKKPADGSRHPS